MRFRCRRIGEVTCCRRDASNSGKAAPAGSMTVCATHDNRMRTGALTGFARDSRCWRRQKRVSLRQKRKSGGSGTEAELKHDNKDKDTSWGFADRIFGELDRRALGTVPAH